MQPPDAGRGQGTPADEPDTGTDREPDTASDSGAGAPEPSRLRGPRDPNGWIDRLVVPLLLFVLALLVYHLIKHDRPTSLDYFNRLADAFLHGYLGLVQAPSFINEVVPSNTGLWYVVYPPGPALVLMPFVAVVGPGLDQGVASLIFGALNAALASVVIRWMGVERGPRIVLTAVFAFGTIVWYSAADGSAWHFAHVVATMCMLLAIHLAQRDARPALIGLFFGLAIMSRLTVAMAFPFFVAYFLDRAIRERDGDSTVFGHLGAERPHFWRHWPRLRDTVLVAWPAALEVVLVLGLYLLYNHARFGSPLQNGYALLAGLMTEAQYREGFFSLSYVPRMVYAMFLTAPQQIEGFPWMQSRRLGGLSILLTTPLFLWVIKARRPDWFGIGAWGAVAMILVPVLMHGDAGGSQFGFRYAQDIYPFLLLLTVRGLRGRLSVEAWIAIAVGAAINLWGMWSTYVDWFM
jgi:hypothetical protein